MNLRVEKGVSMFDEGKALKPSAVLPLRDAHRKAAAGLNTKNETQMKTQIAGVGFSDRQIEILEKIYRSLSNGIRSAKADVPRAWLKQRGLSIEVSGACFNSGQMHHRKPDAFREGLLSVGFMTESKAPTNTGEKGYTVFGNYAVLFPLRNERNQVVNFYAMGIKNNKCGFMNEQGIYPCYPHATTKKLYITSTVQEAATLLESRLLDNRETVIALFDGELKAQHKQAIKSLAELKEVVWINSIPKQEEPCKTK